MKNMITFSFISLIYFHVSFAFEIKPEGPHAGSWSKGIYVPIKDSSTEILHQSDDCTIDGNKVSNSMPVHEIITTGAGRNFCSQHDCYDKEGVFFKECSDIFSGNYGASNNPLLAGAIFNDDPESLMRRNHSDSIFGRFKDYFTTFKEFKKSMEKRGTLTHSSHNRELQFLHSMQSTTDISREDTRKKILGYISENFSLAKEIDMLLKLNDINGLRRVLNKPISTESYYSIFQNHNGDCRFKFQKDLFSCGDFKIGESSSRAEFDHLVFEEQIKSSSRTLALLALGSALHVIQDSYSKSHTTRERDTGEIIEFYNYENQEDDFHSPSSHCKFDQLSDDNLKQIKMAEVKSEEFLDQFSLLDCRTSDEFDSNACKSSIINWLSNDAFMLQKRVIVKEIQK